MNNYKKKKKNMFQLWIELILIGFYEKHNSF